MASALSSGSKLVWGFGLLISSHKAQSPLSFLLNQLTSSNEDTLSFRCVSLWFTAHIYQGQENARQSSEPWQFFGGSEDFLVCLRILPVVSWYFFFCCFTSYSCYFQQVNKNVSVLGARHCAKCFPYLWVCNLLNSPKKWDQYDPILNLRKVSLMNALPQVSKLGRCRAWFERKQHLFTVKEMHALHAC